MAHAEACTEMNRRITDAEGHIDRFNDEIAMLNAEQRALVKAQSLSIETTDRAMLSMDKLATSLQPLVDAHTTFRGVKSAALWITAVIGCGTLVYSVFFQ